jgi:hypothetical protein
VRCQARFNDRPCKREATVSYTTTVRASKSLVSLVTDHQLCERCFKVVDVMTEDIKGILEAAASAGLNPFVKGRQ